MPSVFVQGRPAAAYPPLAPEARRGSVRRVTEVGEEVLHKPCRDVTEFGPDLAALIDDMFRTMYVAEGAGLAANQVGVALRLFVYDCPDDDGVR
ncbi:peptide deformylase, partial [Nocardia asteroides]